MKSTGSVELTPKRKVLLKYPPVLPLKNPSGKLATEFIPVEIDRPAFMTTGVLTGMYPSNL